MIIAVQHSGYIERIRCYISTDVGDRMGVVELSNQPGAVCQPYLHSGHRLRAVHRHRALGLLFIRSSVLLIQRLRDADRSRRRAASIHSILTVTIYIILIKLETNK